MAEETRGEPLGEDGLGWEARRGRYGKVEQFGIGGGKAALREQAELDEDGVDALAGFLCDATRSVKAAGVAKAARDNNVGQAVETVIPVKQQRRRRRAGGRRGGSPGQSHRDHLGVLKTFT